ncbi:Delta-sarcoglycan [Eumeta japonica]|uniref:Delta-sarcoglycan n=1 Tax=Eumeta variegata TaxID=151549 RepID=A0A4C1WL51_EUMVA|nr:Delta-sarcoglycan [Eumeta japonica]
MTGEDPSTVRGWGCTPTEENPVPSTNGRCVPARAGWRRTLLYGILATLMLLIFLNIALTLWIIASLRLTMNGIGPLSVVVGGLQLQGQALIAGRLVTSSLAAPPRQPLVFHSYRNFSIAVNQPEHRQQSKLVMKRDSLECGGRVFDVSDERGASTFRASREQVHVAADALSVGGPAGLSVRAALQTALVRSPSGSNLTLESQTRGLELRAPQSINMESRAGGIDITSHSDINLRSVVGAIKIDAADIYLINLPRGLPTFRAPKDKGRKPTRVYQMCACATGKLFLVNPDSACVVHEDDRDVCTVCGLDRNHLVAADVRPLRQRGLISASLA